jgi:hypothetical protein
MILSATIAVTTIGCGKGFNAASKATASLSAENNSTGNGNGNASVPVTPTLPNLKLEDISSFGSYTNGVLVRFLTNLQGLGGGQFNFTGTSASISRTLACEQGGTVAFNGTATTGASITAAAIEATLTNGSGSLTFNSCKFQNSLAETVTVSGTAALSQISGTLEIALASATQYTFESSNQVQSSGNLQVTTPNTTKSCPFTFTAASVLSGTVAPASGFAINATSTSSVQASLCGVNVNF